MVSLPSSSISLSHGCAISPSDAVRGISFPFSSSGAFRNLGILLCEGEDYIDGKSFSKMLKNTSLVLKPT